MSVSPGRFVRSTQDIEEEFEDLKKCMVSKLAAIEKNHVRDMQGLKDIIDTQRKEIQKLEEENVMKSTAIHELKLKFEDISLQHSDIVENVENSMSDESSKEPEVALNTSQDSLRKTGLRRLVDKTNDGSKVAFFASVTKKLTNLGQDQNIVFDKAVTNIGNGYLPRHGIFMAPVAGTYVFSVTLMVCGRENSWGHFVVNGSIIAKLFVDHQQSSQTIIVYLKQGEDVSVQNTVPGRELLGDRYCTFSGHLLYEDFSVNKVLN